MLGRRRAASSPCSYAAGTCEFHGMSAATSRRAANTRTSSRRSPWDNQAAEAVGSVVVNRLYRRRSTTDSCWSPARCRVVRMAGRGPGSAPPTVSPRTTRRRFSTRTCPKQTHRATFHVGHPVLNQQMTSVTVDCMVWDATVYRDIHSAYVDSAFYPLWDGKIVYHFWSD